MANAKRHRPTLTYADSIDSACAEADVVLLLTEWAQFVAIDPAALADVVSQRQIIDARHALDEKAWSAAGWAYRAPELLSVRRRCPQPPSCCAAEPHE